MQTSPASITWQHCDQPDENAIALNEGGKLTREIILRRLSESFHFPDYFGNNWDAAYDLLLDCADKLEGAAIWQFSIVGASEVNEDALADWVRLMADVCKYAESRGLQLRVVIQSDSVS